MKFQERETDDSSMSSMIHECELKDLETKDPQQEDIDTKDSQQQDVDKYIHFFKANPVSEREVVATSDVIVESLHRALNLLETGGTSSKGSISQSSGVHSSDSKDNHFEKNIEQLVEDILQEEVDHGPDSCLTANVSGKPDEQLKTTPDASRKLRTREEYSDQMGNSLVETVIQEKKARLNDGKGFMVDSSKVSSFEEMDPENSVSVKQSRNVKQMSSQKVKPDRQGDGDDALSKEIVIQPIPETTFNIENSVEDPAIRGSPRDYQTFLVDIAKTKNTIIHLGTGMGKTFIAILCIRHFVEQQKLSQEPSLTLHPKQVLFLVPSVALALQQTRTLRANLPYTVATACWNLTSTRQRLREADILVATHGAIHDLLSHYGDTFSLRTFHFLVIDECHYAQGCHLYKTIMDKWYHTLPLEKRPHILGLTASPLTNIKCTHSDEKLTQMLSQLEQTLDSSIVTFDESCLENRVDADERQIAYRVVSDDSIADFPSFEGISLNPCRPRELSLLKDLYSDVGPLVLSLYVQRLLKELSRNSYEKETKSQFETMLNYLKCLLAYCREKACQSFRTRRGRSEKFQKLENLLKQLIHEKEDTAVGLVFVQRRITAMALHNYFLHRDEIEREENLCFQNNETVSSFMINGISYSHGNLSIGARKSFPIVPNQFDDSDYDPARNHICITSQISKDAEDVFDQFDDADESEVDLLQKHASISYPSKQIEIHQFDDAEETLESLDMLQNPAMYGSNEYKLCQLQSHLSNGSSTTVTTARTSHDIRSGALVRDATKIFRYLNVTHILDNVDDIFLNGNEKTEKSTWFHQEININSTLDAFRNKVINVLFATSIVEEGIDVQACSFVIAFDTANSVKAYVQMKGRARKKNANFFLFTRDDVSPVLMQLQESEDRIRTFVEDRKDRELYLTPASPIVSELLPASLSIASAELHALEKSKYHTIHATVDLQSATSLLNRYILQIPLDSVARSSKEAFLMHLPKYSDYELILPSHLPPEVRVVTLPEVYRGCNKSMTRKMLALMACVRLHKLRLLSDNLLPLGKQDLVHAVLSVLKTDKPNKTLVNATSVSAYFSSHLRPVFLYPILQQGEMITELNVCLKSNSRFFVIISCEPLPCEFTPISYFHPQLGNIDIKLGMMTSLEISESQWCLCAHFFAVIFTQRWGKRSRDQVFHSQEAHFPLDVIAPYTIGLGLLDGGLDWDGMDCIVNQSLRQLTERQEASRMYHETLSLPRLSNPIHSPNMTHIVLGPSAMTCSSKFPIERKGISTFQDYFKTMYNHDVPMNDKLYVVQNIWNQPSKFPDSQASAGRKLSTSTNERFFDAHPLNGMVACPLLNTVLLPQTLLCEAKMADTSIFLLSLMLPQILYQWERLSRREYFVQHCVRHLCLTGSYLSKLPKDKLEIAMTAKSAKLPYDYDIFEWLGDAVLKLGQSDSLMRSPELLNWVKNLHEGDLSTLRSATVSNEFLAAACQRLGFDNFIQTANLARGSWIPCTLVSHAKGVVEAQPSQRPSTKVCADFLESLLGVIYLHLGYKAAITFGQECGIFLPHNLEDTLVLENQFGFVPKDSLVKAAGRITGRECFINPSLIEEAFTHPSAGHQLVPSYQRLEWLGDAVLSLAVRAWIFRSFPTMSLPDMVTMYTAIVSNEGLGFFCFNMGLYKWMNHRDHTLPGKLEYYDWSINEGARALWGSDPPKALSDVMEALIGAAHTDGGYEAGQLAVLTMLESVLLAIRTLRYDVNSLLHPLTKMNHIAGDLIDLNVERESVFFDQTTYNNDDENSPQLIWDGLQWRPASIDGVDNFTVQISAMGRNVVTVVDRTSKSAKNRACALIVAALEKQPTLATRWKKAATHTSRRNSMIRAVKES
jgi:dsRNA-specific ribonuclease/ERCC4-related helicase